MLIDVALLKELAECLPHDNPPATLWHYTSVGAAKAILESRSIRLSCHAFMNDPAEGTVSGSMVSECWAGVVDKCSSHPRLNLSYLRETRPALSYFDFSRPELPPTFLFSLTELQDSLGQWSRYGDNGAGIALGFSVCPEKLPAKSGQPWTTGTRLVRVNYEDTEAALPNGLRALLVELLTKYLPQFRDPTEIENTPIALIHELNPMVKRAAYFEERKWRIITRTVVDSTQLYEIGCNMFGLTPYVPLSLGSGVALTELMLGPKLPKENIWSANWLCKKFGHAPRISMSALAYR